MGLGRAELVGKPYRNSANKFIKKIKTYEFQFQMKTTLVIMDL